MKLRNKNTGKIGRVVIAGDSYLITEDNEENRLIGEYQYLKWLLEEWEDYEEPKEYWYIAELCAGLQKKQDTDNGEDRFNKQIGNYFETEEEAEKAVEKLKAAKRLKDRGFRFVGYNNCFVDYNIDEKYRRCISEDLDLLFGGEE